MKELAKELAPLVASAMRNTEINQRGTEKTFRSPRNNRPRNNRGEKAERDEETQKERLGFLVSQMRLI
jgi:hypothetical protein